MAIRDKEGNLHSEQNGRFVPKGSADEKATQDETLARAIRTYSDEPENDLKAEGLSPRAGLPTEKPREDNTKSRLTDKNKEEVQLTKRDWARIYAKLGEEKTGGYVARKQFGIRLIPLHKIDETDTPKIVILAGSYEKPQLKEVYEFESEEKMFGKMEELLNGTF